MVESIHIGRMVSMEHVIVCGDTLDEIKNVKEHSIQCLITSPPYWAKRVYNGAGELGSEPTPDEYVTRLADFFDQLEPYVRDDGNVFINIGDTFFGSGAGAYSKYADETIGAEVRARAKEKFTPTKPLQPKIKQNGRLYQNKQLLLIPARFAIEMQERGWILRDDIIWHKPNKIPSGVADRFINTYEHVYHFVKQRQYYFNLDAVKVRGKNGKPKNPGDVWSINTQALHGTSHTASFPEELVKRLMLCSTREGDTVLDPFLGTGTTWIVADELHRNCVGFEINREYFDYAKERFAHARQQSLLDFID